MASPRARPRSVDAAEVARFERMAHDWWDPNGPMKPLHRLNPVRLAFIRDCACRRFRRDPKSLRSLEGLTVLDIGCGGGLVAEPLTRLGAKVKGLDPASGNIAAARAHAAQSELSIDYGEEPIEALAARGESFDLVLALEVVEHVKDVAAFMAATAACVKPGGLLVMSTINRTLKSFALAIVGAEYVLRWLPKGTHDWEKFLTPRELTRLIAATGLTVTHWQGLVFSPLAREWRLAHDDGVNYFLVAERA